MGLLGFDFAAGRLDESAHPFSGGVPEDTRLTTRFREDDFVQSMMGTIHETGHARYEQNLPRDWLGQPVALARSMGIHESQSLSFEMQTARSRAFCDCLTPLLVKHFGAQPAFEGGDFTAAFAWLADHIWLQASRWPTWELVTRVSGEALDPGHFRRHLESRYLSAAAH